MTSPTKTKSNAKLLASIVIIIIIVSLAAVTAQYMLSQPPKQGSQLPDMALTLIGSNGQQKNLTKQDILALEPYSAKGGLKVHGNTITGVGTYTGIPVTTLLDLVGGIASGETLTAKASDGYTMTYAYNQVVNGQGFTTYDSVTGSEVTPNQPVKLVLNYYLNGAALPSDQGPLRMGVLGTEGLITQGNIWEKMVIQLKVNPASSSTPTPAPTTSPTATPTAIPTSSPTATPSPNTTSWSLIVNGTSSVTMPQSSFETVVSQSSATYTDSSTSWSGTALYSLVVWAQNNGVISSSALTSGYVVKVISSDGYAVTFNDSRVNNNQNIMIANNANGSALTGNYYSLTLTGSELANNEKVKGIAQIQILPIQHLSVTVIGADGSKVTLFSNDLAKMASITYDGGSKKSNGQIVNVGSYTGVKLIDLCNKVGIASSNTVTVKASDGYTTTFTYEQVANGNGFSTYDASGNTAAVTNPLYLILAYWFNGANFASDTGPLKTMVVGSDGLVTNGNLAARMVVEVDIS